MQKILILGANGQISRIAIDLFLEKTDAELTLYARNARRLKDVQARSNRVRVVEGDVLNYKQLLLNIEGHDAVYANLDGQLVEQAKNIVAAMNEAGVKRLIFMSSMGIYNEVPGENYTPILDRYRDSAAIVEASGLDYTILRPQWLNNDPEILYETTRKGEAFKSAEKEVSRKSVADLIVKLVTRSDFELRQSLGVNKP